jgi:hypothetical protein
MASISERESREIEAANASGTTPVVFPGAAPRGEERILGKPTEAL